MQTVDGVKSASLKFSSADGTPSRAVYYLDGKWRIEEGTEIANIYAKGVFLRFARNQDVAYLAKCEKPFGIPVESFKISSILRAQSGGIAPKPVRKEDKGKEADVYTVDSGPERQVFYVDPATDMPYRCDISYHGKDGWNLVSQIKMEFDTKLDPKLFEAPARKIVNLDLAKPAFLKRIGESRLGAIKTRRGECAIRDVQVSTNGDVFVLYTASGIAGNLFLDPLTISDSLGTMYIKVDQAPRSFNLPGGAAVRSQWFTPVSNDVLSLPRTLQINVYMYNGQVFDANMPTSWKATKRIPKDAKWVTQDMMDPVYEASPKPIYSFKVQKATCPAVPGYLTLIDVPDLTGLSFEMAKKHAQAKYWASKHDWPRAEAAYRTTIEAVNKLASTIGQQASMRDLYDGLAECLEKQGKTEEAQTAKSKADQWRSPDTQITLPATDVPRD